jgi:predicted TIM-barrel fold metal-dependent hydrolase
MAKEFLSQKGYKFTEYDVTKATVEVLQGIFKEFPDLKFLMPHHAAASHP